MEHFLGMSEESHFSSFLAQEMPTLFQGTFSALLLDIGLRYFE
jgi:hypothetical protein